MCKVYEPTKAVYGVLPFNIVVPGINLNVTLTLLVPSTWESPSLKGYLPETKNRYKNMNIYDTSLDYFLQDLIGNKYSCSKFLARIIVTSLFPCDNTR